MLPSKKKIRKNKRTPKKSKEPKIYKAFRPDRLDENDCAAEAGPSPSSPPEVGAAE